MLSADPSFSDGVMATDVAFAATARGQLPTSPGKYCASRTPSAARESFLPSLTPNSLPPGGPQLLLSARRTLTGSRSSPSFIAHNLGKDMGAPHGRLAPGAVASTWSRRLPEAQTSQAAHRVHECLDSVEAALQSRSPSRLDLALRANSGGRFIKTQKAVRKCDSIPILHRHALECALSSQLVQARTVKREWERGVDAIHLARANRDPETLRITLEAWQFAKDDELVVASMADIARWKTMEEALQPILRDTLITRDVKALQVAMAELRVDGPFCFTGQHEAEDMLRCYELQSRSLRRAVKSAKSKNILAAINVWQFHEADESIQAARDALRQRDMQLEALRSATAPATVGAGAQVDSSYLERAINDWKFEPEQAELTAAVALLEQRSQAQALLTKLAEMQPPDLVAIRDAIDAWPFSRTPEACAEYDRAAGILEAHASVVRRALAARDCWKLRHLWHINGCGHALGNTQGSRSESLVCEVNELMKLHASKIDDIWDTLEGSPTLLHSDVAMIMSEAKSWTFSRDDPTHWGARLWLDLRETVSIRSEAELSAAVSSSSPSVGRAALKRCQGLAETCGSIEAVRQLCGDLLSARRTVARMAFGLEADDACEPCDDFQCVSGVTARAISCLRDLREADLLKVRALKTPPPGVAEVFVVTALMLGEDFAMPSSEGDASLLWPFVKQLLQNPYELLQAMRDLPGIAARGRALPHQARACLRVFDSAPGYSLDVDEDVSPGAAIVGAFVNIMLEYDDYLQAILHRGPRSTCHGGDIPALSCGAFVPWHRAYRHVLETEPELAESLPGAEAASPSCHWQQKDLLEAKREAIRREHRSARVRSKNVAQRTGPNSEVLRAFVADDILFAGAWMVDGGHPSVLEEHTSKLHTYSQTAGQRSDDAEFILARLVDSKIPLGLQGKYPATKWRRVSLFTARQQAIAREQTRGQAARTNITECTNEIKTSTGTFASLRAEFPPTLSERVSECQVALTRVLPRDFEASFCQPWVEVITKAFRLGFDSCRHVSVSRGGSPAKGQRQPHSAPTPAVCSERCQLLCGNVTSPLPSGTDLHEAIGAVLGAMSDAFRYAPQTGPSSIVSLRDAVTEIAHRSQEGIPFEVRPVGVAASIRELQGTLDLSSGRPTSQIAQAVRDVVVRFVDLIQSFYEDFLPARAARFAAAAAEADALTALEVAKEATSMIVELGESQRVLGASSQAASDGFNSNVGVSQLSVLGRHAVAIPAPLLAQAQREGDDSVESVLGRPPLADPYARLRWMGELFDAVLLPIDRWTDALSDLRERIDASAISCVFRQVMPGLSSDCCSDALGQMFLGQALCWLVDSECDHDHTWSELMNVFGTDHDVQDAILAWFPPLHSGGSAVRSLGRARDLLYRCWDWYAQGCGGNTALRMLYVWALNVTALLPMLPLAQQLVPAREATCLAVESIDEATSAGTGGESDMKSAWARVKLVLDSSPGSDSSLWWWLDAAGCRDSNHFFELHGFGEHLLPAKDDTPLITNGQPAMAVEELSGGDIAVDGGGDEASVASCPEIPCHEQPLQQAHAIRRGSSDVDPTSGVVDTNMDEVADAVRSHAVADNVDGGMGKGGGALGQANSDAVVDATSLVADE
eukprot:TRINITY_DN34430_c0_g1_i1.p1 TRINITY_DN34430_c0_g1~~TRINITY_DN34430_c0_g1_i1.p1  ORF type:complete len:1612 (+),score=231.98 TRINITY_DN34430_c0_g1_i1:90-4925(+)